MKLHTLLCALLAGAALAAAEKALPVTPETYQPDFSESDIYLPYLKRTPLWMVGCPQSDVGPEERSE